MRYCKVCGKPNCKIHEFSFDRKQIKRVESFSGSSPPEIFIGRFGYPRVNIGILSPQEYGDTQFLASYELWHKQRLSIPEIQDLRSKLILGRTQSPIKFQTNHFIKPLQEVAMASNSVSTEFKLEKPIELNQEKESFVPIIKKAAQVKAVRLQENPKIAPKVDYLANDTDSKAQNSILELEKSKISTTNIIKVLSAGLLGLASRRKLVPTRWSITAVDDILSKEKLKKIRTYPEISEILVFSADYLGNNYHFLLLPERFSFEVIEINNLTKNTWQDYESFFSRKSYAESVTGAYYANRLALAEYLERTKKQGSCLVLREINPEIYTQSMGVGILREISREAFSKEPKKFTNLQEALPEIQQELTLPISNFTEKSLILKNYGKQKKLTSWF